MSWENYQAALQKAWYNANLADRTTSSASESLRNQAYLWLAVARAELVEPDKPAPPILDWLGGDDPDPGVVGARCWKCKHFVDNHGERGCRECGCVLTERI